MTTSMDIARAQLFDATALKEQDLSQALGTVLQHRIDACDLYFESTLSESWAVEDGIVKHGSHSVRQGLGVRAISGEKTGFAYANEITAPALLSAAKAARAIGLSGQNQRVCSWQASAASSLYPALDPLAQIDTDTKVGLLNHADTYARSLDSRVIQVMANLSASYSVICVAGSDGTLVADVRPLVRYDVTVIIASDGRREHGRSGGGGRHQPTAEAIRKEIEIHASEAVRQAQVGLCATTAPAGEQCVVLGSGWPGILLHEAIGHGLEGDFNRKGTSAFSGRIGERIASEQCTVLDDGTLPGRRGSLSVDDEGTPTQSTVLIENGILKGYMQDKLNAKLMGCKSTGNGRRESYAHLPMPRMTNTYMLNGKYTPDEIIASVDKGVYAVCFDGGQVDITSGSFVFSASEAYLIENGKIGKPVKDITLIGNGPDVLKQVSMVGNDFALDSGVGTCGKEGQSVPVGVGQPTLRVDRLTVGGTQS